MAASQLQVSGLRLQSEGLLDTRLTGRVSLKNPANDWQVNIVRLSADLPQLSSLLAQLTQGNTKLPAEVAHPRAMSIGRDRLPSFMAVWRLRAVSSPMQASCG